MSGEFGEVRVENASDPTRVVRFATVVVEPRRLSLGLPTAAITALGLVGEWSEWRQATVYGPARVWVFDRCLTLDATAIKGNAVRLGGLALEHLDLVADPATARLRRSPANGGERVLEG